MPDCHFRKKYVFLFRYECAIIMTHIYIFFSILQQYFRALVLRRLCVKTRHRTLARAKAASLKPGRSCHDAEFMPTLKADVSLLVARLQSFAAMKTNYFSNDTLNATLQPYLRYLSIVRCLANLKRRIVQTKDVFVDSYNELITICCSPILPLRLCSLIFVN